jgi:chromosome segregation ATPase
MKVRSEMIRGDGFDKNVAEKMPKVRQEEEAPPSDLGSEQKFLGEEFQEMRPLEKGAEEHITLTPSKERMETEPQMDVLRLIEDLHTQLLASSRTKRALEIDLTSYQKSVHQLGQDNKDLREQLENLMKELQGLKETQSESIYLKEENADALEKIRELQEELRTVKEALAKTLQQRDEAMSRIHDLESQIEQSELLQIKGKLKEREALHFSEENQELQLRLEEAQTQNMDLERKYEQLRKSFNEVRESLTLLRDSCKTNYYNLPKTPE